MRLSAGLTIITSFLNLRFLAVAMQLESGYPLPNSPHVAQTAFSNLQKQFYKFAILRNAHLIAPYRLI